MGASSILKVETTHPGTVDGIIAFEPVYDAGVLRPAEKEGIRDMLVVVTLAREGEWNTWEEVLHYMKTSRNFRRWNKEAIEAFLMYRVEKTEDGARFRLVVSPRVEASVCCHEFMVFTAETFAQAQCPIVLEHAERTPFFRPEPARQIANKLQGKFFISDAVKSTHHPRTRRGGPGDLRTTHFVGFAQVRPVLISVD